MDLDQRRHWDRFARDFAELLKRLESRTFPNREDWRLVLAIGTVAEELGRPRPVRMSLETGPLEEQTWSTERLVLRSAGPIPRSVYDDDAPVAILEVELGRYMPGEPMIRGTEGEIPEDRRSEHWDRSLSNVAKFLEGTWLPIFEAIASTEVAGQSGAVEANVTRPDSATKQVDPPRFKPLTSATSPRVFAAYECLKEAFPRGLTAEELRKRMEIGVTAKEISHRVIPDLRKLGVAVENRHGIGYYLVPIDPK